MAPRIEASWLAPPQRWPAVWIHGASMYAPAGQTEQAPPLGPENPALQLHAVKEELPAAASEFVGHAEHVLSDVCPVPAEYLPAPQSVQASDPCADLYFPATH